MDKKPITFSSTGRLEPIGELKVHHAAVMKHASGVTPVVIWVDEAGLLWRITEPTTFWELKPEEWPRDIRANYIVGYKTLTGHRGSSPITADSYDQAVSMLKEYTRESHGIMLVEESIHLKNVVAPFPFHDFDKKAMEASNAGK